MAEGITVKVNKNKACAENDVSLRIIGRGLLLLVQSNWLGQRIL